MDFPAVVSQDQSRPQGSDALYWLGSSQNPQNDVNRVSWSKFVRQLFDYHASRERLVPPLPTVLDIEVVDGRVRLKRRAVGQPANAGFQQPGEASNALHRTMAEGILRHA